ncbi:response regulator transcription factor, partial [Paenibacillus alginolyticus]
MIQILLVDDHPTIMEGTKMLLEQEGNFEVSLTNNTEKALEMAKTLHFDLMLIDLHLSDINGIELAKQIISINPDATILIYTGFEFKNHFNLMIEAG